MSGIDQRSADQNAESNSSDESNSSNNATGNLAGVSLSLTKNPTEAKLIEKVEPVVRHLGFGLRDLEMTGGGSLTIRITLEAADGSTTIGIEDCATVHEALSPMFDVWDPVPGAYTLEVSSPGEKATMRLFRHFQAALGHKVRLETLEALPMPAPAKPRRNWEGTLKAIEPSGEIKLEDHLGEHTLRFDQVKAAYWLRDWTTGASPKPGSPQPKAGKTKPAKKAR